MEKSPIVKTVKKVMPAVVTITISKYLPMLKNPFSQPEKGTKGVFMMPKEKKQIAIGGGSGFIIDSSGTILTNRHVIEDPKAKYVIVLEEKEYDVNILAKDPINDVAVLKIDGKNLPTLKMGDSSKLELGETVIAIGNALGTFQNTVSRGVVSGLSREITASGNLDGRIQRLRGLIQTDAAINPGNSGGPLVNAAGEVIGINAAMIFGAENVGFAIPINTAKKDLEDIKKYGRIRCPFLGVRYLLLNREIKEKYNLSNSEGALIISETAPDGQAIIPGSPAEKVGLKAGDTIIRIEDEIVCPKNPVEDILQRLKIGQVISLNIIRDKKEIRLKVEVGER